MGQYISSSKNYQTDYKYDIAFKAKEKITKSVKYTILTEQHSSHITPLGLITIGGDSDIPKKSGTRKFINKYWSDYKEATLIFALVQEIKKVGYDVWKYEARHRRRLNDLNNN